MIKAKTKSELLFEEYSQAHNIPFKKIGESSSKSPDYVWIIENQEYVVEVKQIDEDSNFIPGDGIYLGSGTRTPGSHIREKIKGARNQIREASESGKPTILLIYNNLDPLQLFGTEEHDFLAGMFGEITLTIKIESKAVSRPFHGRNRTFRADSNNNFSAVGHLARTKNGPTIHIYENMYARNPIDYEKLPKCITWNRTTESE